MVPRCETRNYFYMMIFEKPLCSRKLPLCSQKRPLCFGKLNLIYFNTGQPSRVQLILRFTRIDMPLSAML